MSLEYQWQYQDYNITFKADKCIIKSNGINHHLWIVLLISFPCSPSNSQQPNILPWQGWTSLSVHSDWHTNWKCVGYKHLHWWLCIGLCCSTCWCCSIWRDQGGHCQDSCWPEFISRISAQWCDKLIIWNMARKLFICWWVFPVSQIKMPLLSEWYQETTKNTGKRHILSAHKCLWKRM